MSRHEIAAPVQRLEDGRSRLQRSVRAPFIVGFSK
jgi:hypothetical protein